MAALASTILDMCQTPQQTAEMNPSHCLFAKMPKDRLESLREMHPAEATDLDRDGDQVDNAEAAEAQRENMLTFCELSIKEAYNLGTI